MRQFETQETDSNGRPVFYVGTGKITPDGMSICYTKTYENPNNQQGETNV